MASILDTINKKLYGASAKTTKPTNPFATMARSLQPTSPVTAPKPAQTTPTNPLATMARGLQSTASSSSVQNNTINQSSTSPEKKNFMDTVLKGTTITTPNTPTIQTPQTPTFTPSTTPKIDTTKRDTAFQSYLSTLSPSTQEQEARRKYLDFITSAESGIAGLEGQGRGIPLSLVRGQQAKLGQQAEITAKRLAGDVELAQGARTAEQEQAKALFDFEQGLIEEAKSAQGEDRILSLEEAQTLGLPFGTKLSEATVKGITPTAPATDGGFTLGKDQIRYDAQGNVIARGTGAEEIKGVTPKVKGQLDKAQTVINSVDEALSKISPLSTGLLGGITQVIPSSPAYNLDKIIDTINANIGFDTLQAMRDASPTGGALGQVSERELALLQSTIASLKVGQSQEQLKNNLQKVKTHYENWKRTVEQANGITSEIPSNPVKDDIWIAPDGEQYKYNGKSWQSFSSVGNTTASNLPQKNNNPGNVKKGGLADSLAIGTDKQGHLIFPDAKTGFEAMRLDIEAKINGKSRYLPENPTIAQLGKVYAEDPNWSKSVARILGVSPMTNTKNVPIESLINAIARQEGYFA